MTCGDVAVDKRMIYIQFNSTEISYQSTSFEQFMLSNSPLCKQCRDLQVYVGSTLLTKQDQKSLQNDNLLSRCMHECLCDFAYVGRYLLKKS